MAKHSEQLKLKLVRQYSAGVAGTRVLAQQHAVGRSLLRRWISAYEQHGRDGLRKKFIHYDARFKMSVLRHMWKKELSHQKVAAVFDIRSPGCIGKWERQYHDSGTNALAPRPRGRPKTMTRPTPEEPAEKNTPDERTREQLLKEIECLRAEVAYLKKLHALLQAKKQGVQKKKRK